MAIPIHVNYSVGGKEKNALKEQLHATFSNYTYKLNRR